MSQFKWSYTSETNKRYIVGVFHGVRTGHLMIHCNNKIVQVDFNVRQSTAYSFFIEEDLCEVTIEKRDGRFFYDFKINKEVDTPINRKRKKVKRDYRNFLAVFITGLSLILIIGITYGIRQKKKKELEEQGMITAILAQLERKSIGIITNIAFFTESVDVVFEYEDEREGLKKATVNYPEADFTRINERHFPLQEGDNFLVNYHLGQNDAELVLDKITEIQFDKYTQMAINKEAQLHANSGLSKTKCRVKCAYEIKDISGIADFYFQDISVEQNPLHNELTYKRLVRDIPFQKAEKQSCF